MRCRFGKRTAICCGTCRAFGPCIPPLGRLPANYPPQQSPYPAFRCRGLALRASAETITGHVSPVLKIPGLRDIAVRRYGEWRCAQVRDESLKMEYRQACGLTVADGLDLEQVFED